MNSSPNRMVVHLCSVRPFALLVLFILLPIFNFVLITDEEAALLAKTEQKDLFCFSRTFEDLTCFWDEPGHVKGSYRFFYTYEGDVKRECNLTTGKSTDGRWRHVCCFPSDHHSIQVFKELFVEVLDTISNHTMLSQKLSVENVGKSPPRLGMEFMEAFLIEVRNSPICLHDLLPGQWYHIQVRTKPDGMSLNGFWGPWSPVVLIEMPHLPGEINLHCFTPNLQHLHCQWEWMTMEPGPSFSFLYWAEYNSSSKRANIWHKCEEKEERNRSESNSHSQVCTFQPKNASYTSVLVTVTQGQQNTYYFEEPFQLHHFVRTASPKILQATVDKGILKIEWKPPLEELADHMVYQVQYGAKDTLEWKTLQVQYSNNSEIHLSLGVTTVFSCGPSQMDKSSEATGVPGLNVHALKSLLTQTCAILRRATATLGGQLGFLIFTVPVSLFSSVKQKLWPPIPDLHRILDAFFEDNSKQQQQEEEEHANIFFCDKCLEDTPLTCLLEVLPEMPLETPIYEHLLDTIPLEQPEWDSQPSSHQHYMVLSPNNPQGSHRGNEYFDGTGNGCDTLPLPFEHDQHTTPELKIQLSSVTMLSLPLLDSEFKEKKRWEGSANQSTSATHVSNQSYLLMG
ncbi:hypothetical protein JRQ81_015032 [Phrynocephalus forsythii]|uniref:Growth hormone/erythropoietin receptor ligand binding domain-containing protein n=1 Tax=Phrynocephalus forsythii TaxID=171643 RepID=A0A9Q1B3D7_9SAUR|nr:hypothetical protein JRQ81_015032 [Phrynocephalus forsythii]